MRRNTPPPPHPPQQEIAQWAAPKKSTSRVWRRRLSDEAYQRIVRSLAFEYDGNEAVRTPHHASVNGKKEY
jgi:hypothetical protein